MLRHSDRSLALRAADLSYVRPELFASEPARELTPAAWPRPLGTTSRIMSPSSSRCDCSPSAQLSDAERAFIDDISAAARRLDTATTWVFVLLALTALVLLMAR